MTLNRRRLLGASLAGLGVASTFARAGLAQADNNYLPILGDDGKPVPNYRIASELSVIGLPGMVWAGPETADVILVEFFDYNCPFCRKAAADLDAILGKDKAFRLGLVNNAILGLGSMQAAKVQQGVLKLYGPDRAFEFHRRMFAHRGANDGSTALRVARDMGLDAARVETAADGDDVSRVIRLHIELSANLGFAATPSFILNSVGMLGYPGPKSVNRMIVDARKCDQPKC